MLFHPFIFCLAVVTQKLQGIDRAGAASQAMYRHLVLRSKSDNPAVPQRVELVDMLQGE